MGTKKKADDDRDPTPEQIRGSSRKLAEWEESLTVQLTPEQRDQERRKILDHLRDLDRLEAEKKEKTAAIKAEVEAKKSELTDSRNAAERGWVIRKVVVERFISKSGVVDEVRTDTGELLKQRQATGLERQEHLDLFPKEKKVDPPKPPEPEPSKPPAGATDPKPKKPAKPKPEPPSGKDAASGEKPDADDAFGDDEKKVDLATTKPEGEA